MRKITLSLLAALTILPMAAHANGITHPSAYPDQWEVLQDPASAPVPFTINPQTIKPLTNSQDFFLVTPFGNCEGG